jgi:hypothetical protein
MEHPDGAVEFLGILGPVVNRQPVTAMVYETQEGNYYFCCLVCGACGKHWHSPDYTVVQAAHHLHSYDHTPYLREPSDGEDERTD